MNKKVAFVLIFVSLVFSLFAYEPMGLQGVADSNHIVGGFSNPALIYLYYQTSEFVFTSEVSNGHIKGGDTILLKPQLGIDAQFLGKRIRFGIDVNVKSDGIPKVENNEVVYNIRRDVVFDLDVAFGYGNMGFGFGVYGGSGMEQQNVTNLLNQSLLGKYIRDDESQFISIRTGAVYRLGDFTFGAVADGILSYSGSEQELSIEHALDHISLGAFWSQPKYGKRGRLQNWVFDAGIECLNVAKKKNMEFAAGAEAVLQLANEYSVTFSSGVRFHLTHLSKPTVYSGINVKLDMVKVGATVSIPTMNPTYQDPVSVKINLSVLN